MINNYERLTIAKYILNLIEIAGPRPSLINKIIEWIVEYAELLEIRMSENVEKAVDRWGMKKVHSRKEITGACHEIKSGLEKRINKYRSARKSHLQNNLVIFCKELGLNDFEQSILGLAIRYKNYNSFNRLCDVLIASGVYETAYLISAMLGIDQKEVEKLLSEHKHLRRFGLIESSSHRAHHQDFDDRFSISNNIYNALQPPNRTIKDIRQALLGKPCSYELDLSDFDHMQKQRDLLTKLLKNALAKRARGINILLYGPVGTGKTEFCKTVAHHLGISLYPICEVDEDGDAPNRNERISALLITNKILSKRKKAALLFDEMEDLADSISSFPFANAHYSGGSRMSKVFLNRLFENNSVPTFWTCNSINSFDPAMLRRMTMAIKFDAPSLTVRKKTMRRLANKNKIRISGDSINTLACEFHAPPALINNSIRAAKLSGGGEENIRTVLSGMTKLIGLRPSSGMKGKESNFSPELLSVDHDIEKFTSRIVNGGIKRNFSLCLYGPPGTGKSFYLRQLAKKLQMEVLQKRASDLLSMWVGGSEKNIAEAFEQAREQGAFLIFDECDSLLQNRNLAQRSWEVTQVNEMLTWMENHELPFACTTNLVDSLDHASLRRFTFKVKFNFLSPDQTTKAYRLFFGAKPPKAIQSLNALTPGDFVVVRRKAEILNILSDKAAIIDLLEKECELKPNIPKRIGF